MTATEHGSESSFDAVVVGAGPAGSAAALVIAEGGARVALVERGPEPGAKNLYGGVIYPAILGRLIPDYFERAPIERRITRRVTMLMDGTRATWLAHDNPSWGDPAAPNAFTAYRPAFDRWLAGEAVRAGAVLLPSTTATRLLKDANGRVAGVATDREGPPLRSRIVIAADGANSLLAKQAGLLKDAGAESYTLGVKQVLGIEAAEMERRFNIAVPGEGVDIEILGCTEDIPGGGFLYTNSETVSVGLVLSLAGLAGAKRRPEELLESLRRHPSIEPFLRGAEPVEYGAHLIPEAGYSRWPRLGSNGLLVAGDAAFTCLAAGLWLEGVNYAIASGAEAGRAALAEVRSEGAADAAALYTSAMSASFVGVNHRRLRHAPALVMSRAAQVGLPRFANQLAGEIFSVRDPEPKPGLARAMYSAARRSGVGPVAAGAAALRALKAFG